MVRVLTMNIDQPLAAYQRDVTRAKRAEGRKLKAERKTG